MGDYVPTPIQWGASDNVKTDAVPTIFTPSADPVADVAKRSKNTGDEWAGVDMRATPVETPANTQNVPDAQALANKPLTGFAEILGAGFEGGKRTVAKTAPWMAVMRGDSTVEEAQRKSLEIGDTKEPDFTGDAEWLKSAKQLTYAVGGLGPQLGDAAYHGITDPFRSLKDLTDRLYAVAATPEHSDAKIKYDPSDVNGAMGSIHDIAAAQTLEQLVGAGVPLQDAKNLAQAVGVVAVGAQVAASAVGGGTAASAIAGKIAIRSLAKPTMQQVVKAVAVHTARQFGKAGAQAGVVGVQNAAGIAAQIIGRSKTKTPMTLPEIQAAVLKGVHDSVLFGAAMHGASELAGGIAGQAKAIHSIPDVKTPENAMQFVHTSLFDEPAELETAAKIIKSAPAPDHVVAELDRLKLEKLQTDLLNAQEKLATNKKNKSGSRQPLVALIEATKKQIDQQEVKAAESFAKTQAKLLEDAKQVRDAYADGAERANTKGARIDTENPKDAKILPTPKGLEKGHDVTVLDFYGKTVGTVLQKLPKAQREAIWDEINPSKAIDAAEAQKMQQRSKLEDKLMKATGMSGSEALEKIIAASSEKNGMEVHYKKPFTLDDGTVLMKDATWKGTQMEGVGFLLDSAVKKNAEGFKTNGWTLKADEVVGGPPSLETLIRNQLTDKNPMLFKVADAIQKFFKEDNLPILRKALYDDTGKVLKEVRGYSGKLLRKNDPAYSSYDKFVDSVGGSRGAIGELDKPGQVKARVDNTLGVDKRNPFISALDAINKTAHYSNMTKLAKTYNVVFNSDRVQQAIRGNQSPAMNDAIRNQAAYIVRGAANEQSAWLTKVLNAWATRYGHVLLVNPLRYPKHVATVMSYSLADIGGGKMLPSSALVKGITEYHGNAASINDFLWKNSKALNIKYGDSRNAIAGSVSKGGLDDLTKDAFQEFVGAPLVKGAQYADQMGMWSVFQHMKHLGHDDASAMSFAEKAMKTTQFSNSPDQLSSFALNKYTKLLGGQFTQYPTKIWQHIALSVREAKNFPSATSIYNAARVAGAVRLAQLAFVGVDVAYINAVSQDQKEKDRANWHLLASSLIAPTPLFTEHLLSDPGAFVHDASTKYLSEQGFDIAPSHDRGFGWEFMPVQAAESWGSAAVKGWKAGTGLANGEEVSPVQMIDIALDVARGPSSTLRLAEHPLKLAKLLMKGRE